MREDAGRQGRRTPPARRPGTAVTTAVAVVLLLGGGTAVAVGLTGPDATPPPALTAPTELTAPTGPTAPTAPTATPLPAEPTTPDTGRGIPAPASSPVAPTSTAGSPTPAASSTAEVVTPVAAPVSVSIPAIGVESELLHLGLNEDRTLQVPQGDDFDTAAWFDGSPRPGEVGPAVIEGHVSSRARGPSVFYELSTLSVGDTVDVGREDGSTATFEVYDLQQFPKDSFPTLQVYGNTPGPELRLITCGGTIAESSGHFTDNVIVFAREV